jgi:hypothetical protein
MLLQGRLQWVIRKAGYQYSIIAGDVYSGRGGFYQFVNACFRGGLGRGRIEDLRGARGRIEKVKLGVGR